MLIISVRYKREFVIAEFDCTLFQMINPKIKNFLMRDFHFKNCFHVKHILNEKFTKLAVGCCRNTILCWLHTVL
jgi:hypothetical protein